MLGMILDMGSAYQERCGDRCRPFEIQTVGFPPRFSFRVVQKITTVRHLTGPPIIARRPTFSLVDCMILLSSGVVKDQQPI